jgi:nickel-dependent lactate racemase
MPEIWLGYGDSNVILDIKYENISNINKADFTILDHESLSSELENKIELGDSTLILNFNPFVQMIPILMKIKEKSNRHNISGLEIGTLSANIPLKIRRELNDHGITIHRIETSEILSKIKYFKKTILLEKIEYDPFFGYKGAPTEIMRSIFPGEMNQAYSTIIDKHPRPGVCTEPLNIALESSKLLNLETINVIANNDGINSVHCGDIKESFKKTVDDFNKISKRKTEKSKSAFISGNSNFNIQSTLGNSLNLLWNNYHAVKENGIIILLSENKMGMGNGALLKFIENRLDQSGLKKHEYIKDLEHLNFFNLIKDKIEVYIISTLPKVYLSKLGIKTISRVQEGLETILNRYGKNSKTTVILNSELTHVQEQNSQQ